MTLFFPRFWFVFVLKHFWTPDELLHLAWQRKTPLIFLPVIRSFVMIRWYFLLLLQNLFLFSWQRTHCCRIYSHYGAPVWIAALQNTWFVFATSISYRDTHHAIALVKYCKTAISVNDGHWFGGWFLSLEQFLPDGEHNDSATFWKIKRVRKRKWALLLLVSYPSVSWVCMCVHAYIFKGWIWKDTVILQKKIKKFYIQPLHTQKRKLISKLLKPC